MKKIALLLLMTTASVANQGDSHRISHNQVINYKSLYVQSLAELERLESMEDNLESELNSLKEKGKEIAELKKDINDTYQPRIDLAKSLSKQYYDAYITYYGLINRFRQVSYSKRITDWTYDNLLSKYKAAYIYAKTKVDLGGDRLRLDMYNRILVNGERLVK